MTPAEFQRLFESRIKEIQRYAMQDLPRHIGKIGVDLFHENFVAGGFMDQQLEPWVPSKRIGAGKGASSGYGTLLSSRKELYNSIRYQASDGRTKIISSLRYSRIHNEGGDISQAITPQMRRFAWAKYYQDPQAGGMWKGLALTKKTARTIHIPRRQYMGHSAALNQRIYERIWNDVRKIITTN